MKLIGKATLNILEPREGRLLFASADFAGLDRARRFGPPI
jgi:hypothetical protein